MSDRGRARRRLYCTALLLALPAVSLRAQGTADTLNAGKRAYERAEFGAASRLLAAGVLRAARDTSWSSAVHMLVDLLETTGDTARAGLWARWAARAHPDLVPDTVTFPPRVTQALAAARRFVGGRHPDDTLIATTWTAALDTAPTRGALRVARATGDFLVVVDGAGTVLPGETRTLAAGTWTLRVLAEGFAPLQVQREVLPGIVTTVAIRLRPGAAAVVAADRAPAPVAPAGPSVAAGGGTTCRLLAGRHLTCWGDNRLGQLGAGTADSLPGPGLITGDSLEWAAVSVGPGHACALTRGGRAYCWGNGVNGQLGTGQTAPAMAPVAVAGGHLFRAVAVGALHSCALTGQGVAMCWGTNRDGQLGNRSEAASARPVAAAMPAGTTFTRLVAGASHTCGLTDAGAAWCWGANASGQLGTGNTSSASQPVAVLGGLSFRDLAAGQTHTCAVTTAGAAWCWGANTSGQLGTGTPSASSLRPASVAGGFTSFVQLSAGDAHTCALTPSLATYCWGAGRAGQLGNGQTADSPQPVLVIGGQDYRTLSLGAAHSCGTAADGVTWCWGDNSAGQVGALAPPRGTAVAVPVLARAPMRTAAATSDELRGLFDEGGQGPAWQVDSARGGRVVVSGGAVSISRAEAGPAAPVELGAGVHIPIARGTALHYDVMVEHADGGCGLNCGVWPAAVRVRVRNSDLSESELWLVHGDTAGFTRTLGPVTIVAVALPARGAWVRGRRVELRELLPRADTVLAVSVGGVGSHFAVRFDNVAVPAPLPAAVAFETDTARLTRQAPARALVARARDAAGRALPWVTLLWNSSDTLVARVDERGVVTGVGPGTAVIRARSGTLADSARVRSSVPRARRPAARAPRGPTP